MAENRLSGLRPVGEELGQALLGEWVDKKLAQHAGWHRRHMRPQACRLDHMKRVAHGGDQHLRLELRILAINGDDISDELHAGLRNIIETPDERRDEGGTGLRGEDRLAGRKAERDIDHRAFIGERLACLEPVDRKRHLDGDVFGEPCQPASFRQHGGVIRRRYLSTHGPGDDGADFLHDIEEFAAALGYKRGIRRNAVDEPRRGEIANVAQIGAVDEEFHGRPFPSLFIALRPHTRLARPRSTL